MKGQDTNDLEGNREERTNILMNELVESLEGKHLFVKLLDRDQEAIGAPH